MLKRLLPACFLALSLASCSHSGAPLSVVAPPSLVDAGKDAAAVSDVGVDSGFTGMTTFKDTNYEITVPSDFVKRDSSTLMFLLVDRKTNSFMTLESLVWPDTLDELVLSQTVALIVNGATTSITTQKVKWMGLDARKMGFTIQASLNAINSFVWMALENGRGYSFACSVFNSNDLVAAETICSNAANGMKLIPLPAPAK